MTVSQAAKTAGKTVRAFKPTFDELTSVSRDLRSTLDEELGINDIRNEFRVSNSLDQLRKICETVNILSCHSKT